VVEATHAGSLALFQEVQLLRVTEHDFSCPIARQKYPTHPHAHAEATHIFRFHAAAECGGDEALTPQELTDTLVSIPQAKQPGSDGIPYKVLVSFITIHPILHTELEKGPPIVCGKPSASGCSSRPSLPTSRRPIMFKGVMNDQHLPLILQHAD
jgi:hypothetical protein